jgi:hypothetical protein
VKRIAIVVVLAFLAQYLWNYPGFGEAAAPSSSGTDSVLAQAFQQRQGNLQVQGMGAVIKVLPDDRDGSRHQRFILKLDSGQTILVAHNIDLAPRIDSLATGDSVEFFGEYEWNARGGVIHWTHDDPRGQHTPGWLKHSGRIYQ